MRALACRAPRPAWPKTTPHPIRAKAITDHARPRPPPRPQTAPTTWARNPPEPKVQLDNNRIMTYREHQRAFTRQNGPA